MFSIAKLLDTAKAKAGIDSDYQLAKLIEINQSAVTNYRSGRSLPNEQVLQRLCALSGDDLDIVAAQVQSRRSMNEEARQLWQRVAQRLQAGVAQVCMLFAIAFIAFGVDSARASGLNQQMTGKLNISSVAEYTSYWFKAIHRWLAGVSGLVLRSRARAGILPA